MRFLAYKTKNGLVVRTPEEKAKRFERQLKRGMVTETGEALTKNDRTYRVAYINAVNDCKKQLARNKSAKSRKN